VQEYARLCGFELARIADLPEDGLRDEGVEVHYSGGQGGPDDCDYSAPDKFRDGSAVGGAFIYFLSDPRHRGVKEANDRLIKSIGFRPWMHLVLKKLNRALNVFFVVDLSPDLRQKIEGISAIIDELAAVLLVDGRLALRDPRIHGYLWIGLNWID